MKYERKIKVNDRFFSDGKKCAFWKESDTVAWIKLLSLPANGKKKVLKFENDCASPASNVPNTFIREIDGAQPVKGSWHLDEGSGNTTKDSSGQGNDGTLVNGPTWVDGKYGKALSFNGSDDYVSTPLSLNTVPKTYEAWIYHPTISGGWKWIIGNDNGNYNGHFIVTNGSTAKFEFVYCYPSTCDSYPSNSTLSPNQWYHVVASVSSTNVKIFINGILDKEYSELSIGTVSGVSHVIGKHSAVSSYYFNGIIDEVRIYNRALSAEEISDLYGTGGDRHGYTTTNYPGRVLVRKYASPEPTVSIISNT